MGQSQHSGSRQVVNPYERLPPEAFWSSAVARRPALDIANLWSSPFRITPQTRIATYGSCFAQHFSRALLARRYSWLNAEPGPAGLSEDLARQFGYGVFSSRTGNIYTTSLLHQWVSWALGLSQPPPVHWERDGRIYDPFRPMVEPAGFGSVAEMLTSRAYTIAAFRHTILTCDLLVFTLGLTESWWDARDGVEYAICPGTRAGTFEAERHVFRNEDYETVRDHLVSAIAAIRKARGAGPNVLLTVSPVPLVATNAGQHVLVATTASKSILRAVAGKVAERVADVSYFPSYEIVNSPVFGGQFFEANLRSVSPRGVTHVMNCFFAGVEAGPQERGAEVAAIQAAPHPPDAAAQEPDDVACDEELLDAFGRRT